ncbi:MAG: DUF2341 domain-containing protein [Candidatus Berkelbacteria bacterium]|nr:DUF2341 domain-containing protein [Candidatus Berkelbacteria bacterium]
MGRFGSKKLNLVLIILVVVASIVFVNLNHKSIVNQKTAKAANWYNSDWKYRTKITIDKTKVVSNQTAFPVLVSSTVNDWRTIANGGYVAQSTGQDFVFIASDQTTKLPHEIESYTNTTGNLIVWIKTNVSSSANTDIYLYYGNAGCADQQDKTNVWSSYAGVWHMSEGAGTAVADSTSNVNSGNFTGTGNAWITNAKIGNGLSFDTHGQINLTNSATLRPTSITVSTWLNTSDNFGHIYFQMADQGYRLHIDDWQKPRSALNSSLGFDWTDRGTAFSTGNWHFVTYVYDGINTATTYVDGEVNVTDTTHASGSLVYGDTTVHQISTDWNGLLDDVRVSSGIRSADWIKTEFNNQNSPATFYSLTATEAGDITPPTNPGTINGYDSVTKGSALVDGNWNHFANPYFEFSGATDDSAGVAGYYIYFGSTADANPQTSGDYQAHSGGIGAIQNYTSATSLIVGSSYYLRIKTKDNNSNVSAAATIFTYKYDNVVPDPPEYVNVSPAGCSTSTSFTFTWPAASDTGGSGFKTYQYRRGTTGVVTDNLETTLQTTAYQDGDNILYVRSEDNAGNVSAYQTSVFCSTAVVQVVDGPTVVAGPSSITATWVSSKATTGYIKVYEGNTYISEQGLTDYSMSHTVKVIGLEPEKSYRYQITWTDQSGNLGQSDWYTTTTATAPQINNLKIDILSPTSINVSWSSTIAAKYGLEYGIGNYGTVISSDDYLTGYSSKISNLSAGITYQFRVNATGQDGTKFFAGESVVMPPLPSIGGLKFEPITGRPDTAISVSWTTNVEITSSVFFGVKGGDKKEISTSDKVRDHKIEIGNLTDNSDYEIYATGIDQFGNMAKSGTESFKTAYDTRPPVISEISSDTSNVGSGKTDQAQITVGYSTDEPAKCQIEYADGISGDSYSSKNPEEDSFSTTHLSVISNLKPQAPYHYQVICHDHADNTAKSSAQTIISGEVTQSVFNIILKTLNNLFGWLGKGF